MTVNAGVRLATGATIAARPVRTATSTSAVPLTSRRPAATARRRDRFELKRGDPKIVTATPTAITAAARALNTGQKPGCFDA